LRASLRSISARYSAFDMLCGLDVPA